MGKLVKCKTCGEEIAKSAKVCPKCGAKQKKGKSIGCFFAILGIVFIFAVVGGSGDGSNEKEIDRQESNSSMQVSDSPSHSGSSLAEPELEDVKDDDVPQEYKNALKKAENYSKTLSMSKQAIYDQLVSEYGEKFPADAAQYAIDNLDADFKENALKKAKSYYETMSMSKEAIRDQLVSEYGERFTEEEADYAIANLE